MLLTQINNNNSVFNYRIVDIDKNTYEDCIPFMMTGQLSLIINYPKIPVNNTILLSSIFSDTIYRYDRTDNVIKPAYFFKNKLKPAKREYFGGDYELATHAAFTAEKNGISHGIKELRTTRNYINFIYLMKKKYYNLFYNTDTNTGYYSETNWDNIYSILFCWGKTSTDDAFVSVIEPDKIIYLKSLGEKKWNQLINTVENEELKNIILNTDIDDNPILLFYKFD